MVQSKPTRDIKIKSTMLQDYAATYPNEVISYKYSNMVLHVDSYAAYLTMTETRSCYSGHFYLRNWPPPRQVKYIPKRNGPFHT